ncbi:MAG: MOSC N-terminal beta barrel domain-containing protein, partial [Candidatus Binataceae bacterium]
MRRQIGAVQEVFRYPVKSMLGERLAEFEVGINGIVGDRAWGLRETNGRIASAKKWPGLLDFRAAYDSPPQPERLAPVRITTPDGRGLHAEDTDASAIISAVIGRAIQLERARPDEHSRGEIDPATIFGDVGVERVMPQFTVKTLPDTFGLHRGGFQDSAAVHLLASGTLAHLRALIGADAQVDARRFRPNIVIDTGAALDAFVEDEWLEGELRIGAGVRIASMQPALR